MIVCSCNAFSDCDVQSIMAGAAQRPRMSQVYASLGCSAKCGRCTPAVKRIMDEACASSINLAAEQPACNSLMTASASGTSNAVRARSGFRLVDCPSPWRQSSDGKSPCLAPTQNSLAGNSHRWKPSWAGTRAERPSVAESDVMGTPLHERGECLDQAA
jgi:bacterioferritin-associated ferredoxin